MAPHARQGDYPMRDGMTRTDDSGGEGESHVVIVGAGFGGLEAARALTHAPVQVTVIDHTNHHVFQPLLYQVATAELSPADISAPIRAVLRHQPNAEVLMGEVIGVDIQHRFVTVAVGGERRAVPYDLLVLATGAGQSYFGHDDWARFAPGLKTTGDAMAIWRHLLLAFEQAEMEQNLRRRYALMTFVVVGGGPPGVELAGAIAELARTALRANFRHIEPAYAQVVLVEAQERILPTFSARLAQGAEQMLRRLGVTVRTATPVERVDADGVVLGGGERLAARTVIWAAGVHASPAALWLGPGIATDRAGRVQVGPRLTVPQHPEIFVIGDTSSVRQDGRLLPGVAPVAKQEGHYVARVIAARASGSRLPAAFRYHDRGSLATIGRTYAVGTLGGLELSGKSAWLVWGGVHLGYLIGFRNRVLVLFQWLWLYVTFQRSARLLPAEPSSPAAARCARSADPLRGLEESPAAPRGA